MFKYTLFVLALAFTFTVNTQTSLASVSQQMGFYDTQYSNLTNDDCKSCHGLNTTELHHSTYQATTSNCGYCHLSNNGQLEVNRDCISCHYSSPHHQSAFAINGQCAACHSPNLVTSVLLDPGVFTPPGAVTPAVCRKCHVGSTSATPPIGESRDLHHDSISDCQLCHYSDMTTSIRLCEQCHQPTDLHWIHTDKCGSCHSVKRTTKLPPAQPKPNITSLSTTFGKPGATVVVNGVYFGSSVGDVKVGIISANIQSWQDNAITITVPDMVYGTYSLGVINSAGSSNQKLFTVLQDGTTVTTVYGIPDKLYVNYTETDCRTCHGINTAAAHHASLSGGQCTLCHTLTNGVYSVVRDCKVCHTTTPHHSSDLAKAGVCTGCHSSSIISDFNTVPKPTILPDTSTPTPANCNTCHTTPSNYELHEGTGLLDCAWCHGEATQIRSCENCHSVNTLHNVSTHLKPENCKACHGITPGQQPPSPSGVPDITSLSSNSGGPGTNLTITGYNFGSLPDQGRVHFNTYDAPVISWSDTSITVRVPSIAMGNYLVNVVNPVGTSNGREFTITTPGSVSGKVVDNYGNPLAGAYIVAGTKYAYSDANGLYQVTGLPQGLYTIQASLTGYSSAKQSIAICDNIDTKLDFTLTKTTKRRSTKNNVINY